ncbi:Glycoside hydrolase, 38 vacuolar alpha mannosidase [Dispira simplex]|nr:Glycoside hydrolase, 38 vacuolar alpha mannosidase [Dispira simplex]
MGMQKHRAITRDRFSKFLSAGRFGDVSLFGQLTPKLVSGSPHVRLLVYSVPNLERISFTQAMQGEYRSTQEGESFGPTWSTHWFKVSVTLPDDWVGEEVEFRWDAGCEGLLWTTDGQPIHGLISGTRVEYILTRHSVAGSHYEFYVEMACNDLFGAGGSDIINPPDPNRTYCLSRAQLAVNNVTARELWRDFEIIRGMVDHLPANSSRGARALTVANQICNTFDRDDPTSLNACRKIAQLFLGQTNSGNAHVITAVGNCHIDTAWLWPFDETKRKVARSWSTQVQLMERYPWFKFAASQAQQFQWLKELYPQVFSRVQEKIAQGQFIPIGGTWVEMDANMPSGEALVRQFLFGQRFFAQNFGQRCQIFWLPDTFGYSAQLPQIVREAGMRYFFTQKLSWNNINEFPHTTFYWIGLDGSRVLTHMAPSNTYAAQGTVEELVKSVTNHKDLAYTNESLLLYGNGDGGGGPLPAMLDRLERLQDLDGLPKVVFDHPNTFYERVERDSPDLVSWKGELYFELHRGTYTSQAAVKHGNRICELLLRDLELIATQSWVAGKDQYRYPQKEINHLWELLLLNQFHDVLPGSSIGSVYEDARRFYKEIRTLGSQLIDDALYALYKVSNHQPTGSPEDLAEVNGIFVYNSLPWDRTEVIKVALGDQPTMPLTLHHQRTSSQDGMYMVASTVPAMGCQVTPWSYQPSVVPVSAYFSPTLRSFVLENIYLYARFDEGGRLQSLVDRRVDRELIPKGAQGNVLRLYEDIPIYWDAWDVEVYHLEKGRDVPPGEVQLTDSGPLVGSLVVNYHLGTASTCRQVISLSAISPRLDFECTVDWHENRRILKAEFTVDITSDVATYETQFGWVQRPTHFNTTWDLAKFEVCGHKYADLSEYGYGVALFNDSKYGYSTYRNTMRLSLLRSPKAPDEHCDMGLHHFRYALYPHKGTFFESDVVQAAYQFNVPIRTQLCDTRGLTGAAWMNPLFRWEGASNVILETVKKAEDDDAVIVRLYEAYGGQGRGTLMTLHKVKRAHRCNLLEDNQESLDWNGEIGGISLRLSPFQILTVKIYLHGLS